MNICKKALDFKTTLTSGRWAAFTTIDERAGRTATEGRADWKTAVLCIFLGLDCLESRIDDRRQCRDVSVQKALLFVPSTLPYLGARTSIFSAGVEEGPCVDHSSSLSSLISFSICYRCIPESAWTRPDAYQVFLRRQGAIYRLQFTGDTYHSARQLKKQCTTGKSINSSLRV